MTEPLPKLSDRVRAAFSATAAPERRRRAGPIEWSADQEGAIKAVRSWLRDPDRKPWFYLAGFAGTGKTTLATTLAQDVRGEVLYGAFTGKAALVLARKGCHGARTIHSMIYVVDDASAVTPEQPTFQLNPMSDVKDAALVVIDEVSMVGEELARDLLSFKTPVLVLGDPAQLPPVKDAGFFTARQPDVMLTEVHRQAQDNPIIRMSMKVRAGERLDVGDYGDSRVIPRSKVDGNLVLPGNTDQVIVGLNRTRLKFNTRIRELLLRFDPTPRATDRLICLKNDRKKRLLNGGIWNVIKVEKEGPVFCRMLLSSDDFPRRPPTRVAVLLDFFSGDDSAIEWERKRHSDQFTYAYAITCHKSQGSQWDDVVIFDESAAFREDRARWLYTGITRAAERVTVVVGGTTDGDQA